MHQQEGSDTDSLPAAQHLALSTFFDFAFLLALTLYILVGTPLTPFHGDEATQIYMSRDYAYQFQQRDLDLVRYQDDAPIPQMQYLRLINGSVNKYLMGLAWHLGGLTVDDVNEQWDWGADWEYNVNNNHAPSAALLQIARWPSALLLAASVVVLFVLAKSLGGRPVAYLACLYFVLNPTVLINGRRATMEGSLYCFSLLTVLAGYFYLRRPSWRTTLFLGAASGLAVASKHTALFTVAPVFAACLLIPFARRRPTPTSSPRADALRLIAAAGLALLIFYALNPVWWGTQPVDQAVLILRLRGDLLAGQTATFDGYASRIDQLAGFLRQVFVAAPQYYEDVGWGDWIAGQIAAYEASPWHGLALGGSVAGAIILGALTLAGVVTFFRERVVPFAGRWLVGWWALGALATTLLLTPLEWQRYYLPIYPLIGLFAGFGLTAVARAVAHRRSMRGPSPATPT